VVSVNPRQRGDHGMAPTPKSCTSAGPGIIALGTEKPKRAVEGGTAHLERGEHLPLFLPVCGVMEVLHGDERGELVIDGVVCRQ
jgi:hypothetical protein